ncbi:hypothetical protein [Moheibacter sediminis]|uniref:Uncharacterized protein n=1 Tax=Moheibacter sediminis TaxID=1434700 RepID=A0A1W2A9E4_9FLAO|nr:hypothetical protein [Moheibacter sediminis]SMC57031.1 hypothetical protein SAMN06296427_10423 [Moheibacter sediminis]
MKSIFYISFAVLSSFCLGQQTFQFTDGELEYVTKKTGIIIKKDNEYYQLQLNFPSKISEKVNFKLEKTSLEILKSETEGETIFYASDISSYDFNKIKNVMFTAKEDDEIHRFFALNNESIIHSRTDFYFDKKRTYPESQSYYFIIDFGNGKKILCFENYTTSFIISHKNKLTLLHNSPYDKSKVSKIGKLKAIDINGGIGNYITDTLADKKIIYKNVFGQNVLNDSFDSICIKSPFIVTYQNNKINIYNSRLQKLPLKNVRAFYVEKYFPILQILQKNKVRKINLLGKNYKRGDGPDFVDLSYMFPDREVEFKIIKKNDDFYMKSNGDDFDKYRWISKDTTFYNYEHKVTGKLYHAAQYDSIRYFDDFMETMTLYSEADYKKSYPILLYCKLKNGKYDLSTIEYLLLENPPENIIRINNELPKNLDQVIPIDQDTYRIEKDGLSTYYPIIKEIKYKKLGVLDRNFARFTLPNGQKGWLDKEGNEYLDE